MIKKNFILLMLLVVNPTTYLLGQGIEYRSQIDFPKEDYHISLVLFEKYYDFNLVYDKLDMCTIISISSGKYEILKDDSLIMHDDVNGFDMIMTQVNENCIIVDNGLCFTDSLMLCYYKDTNDKYIKPKRSTDEIQNEKAIFQPQTSMRDFMPGKYEIIHLGAYMLDIHKDMTYKYTINQEIVVSEGVCERHGNLLVFYDNCVGEVFTATIEDGYILGRYFLGDWGDKKYRIIQEEEYLELIPSESMRKAE